MGGTLKKSDIQAVVFDIDGTLYDINDVIKSVYRTQVEFVQKNTGMSAEAVEILFGENFILPYRSEKARSATELFGKLGLDLENWSKYKSSHFDVDAIDASKSISQETMVAIKQKYELFAITSNTKDNAFEVLSRIGIDYKLFTEIYTSDNVMLKGPFQKKRVMELICKKYGLNPRNMLSIGDRYETDIRPMLELGGRGLLLNSPDGLMDYIENADGHLKSEKYKLF